MVRIYRRDEKDHGQVVGVVEFVGNAQQKAFKTLDELCMLLSVEGCKNDGKKQKLESGMAPGIRRTGQVQD